MCGFYFVSQNPTNITPYVCSHSWNVTKNGTIIDVYPVGFVSTTPIMIPATGTKYSGFMADQYIQDDKTTEEVSGPELYRQVCVLEKYFRLVTGIE